jgi:hypothetical protein
VTNEPPPGKGPNNEHNNSIWDSPDPLAYLSRNPGLLALVTAVCTAVGVWGLLAGHIIQMVIGFGLAVVYGLSSIYRAIERAKRKN